MKQVLSKAYLREQIAKHQAWLIWCDKRAQEKTKTHDGKEGRIYMGLQKQWVQVNLDFYKEKLACLK